MSHAEGSKLADEQTLIWHYTSVMGLISIVETRELWATDARFLNDGAEIQYARDLFFSEVKKLQLPQLEDGGYCMPDAQCIRVFVTCFCENGDLLSQWRGYGDDQGYALGFDPRHLQISAECDLTRVTYGLADPAAYFAEEIAKACRPTAHPGTYAAHAAQSFFPRLAAVKHPTFAEERELRLIRPHYACDIGDPQIRIRFRPSPLGPVPYVSFSFTPDCLRAVIVGPGSHTTARQEAVTDLLRRHGFIGTQVDIRTSGIPLRR